VAATRVGWALAPRPTDSVAAIRVARSSRAGFVLSDNTMALLHAHEMVLPAHISSGLQTMISNNSNSTSTTTGPSNQNFNWENHFHKAGDVNQQTFNN
jgi:hypothetical protein